LDRRLSEAQVVEILEQANVQHTDLVDPNRVGTRRALSDVLVREVVRGVGACSSHECRVVGLRDDFHAFAFRLKLGNHCADQRGLPRARQARHEA
jgi:hypothetical protein